MLGTMDRACPSCGSRVGPADRFCERCGTRVDGSGSAPAAGSRFCTRCGAPLEADARFCGRCGAPVRAAGQDATEPAEVLTETQKDEDPLAEWERHQGPLDFPGVAADEAPTESIPTARPIPRRDDTAILPAATEEPPSAPAPPPVPGAPPPRGFPWGATFAVIGAVAVILSSLLEWGRTEAALGGIQMPRDIPLRSLIDPASGAEGLSLGLTLLLVGTAGALVSLLTMVAPAVKFLRRLTGLAAVALPGLYVFRVVQSAVEAREPARVVEVLGLGVYVAAGGALVLLVAGRWFRR